MNEKRTIRWRLILPLGCLVVAVLAGLSWSRRAAELPGPADALPRERAPLAGKPLKTSDEETRADLIEVIESQLSALRRDDYPKAFHYAATSLREQMPLPTFEQMVRRSYPAIAHSSSAQFGLVFDNGEEAIVEVGVVDAAGKVLRYRYMMHWEASGWRINGVVQVASKSTLA